MAAIFGKKVLPSSFNYHKVSFCQVWCQ